jgi:hypothetical protein
VEDSAMMTRAAVHNQTLFYRKFVMARGNFDPKDFGVNLDKEAFVDQMVEDFAAMYRGQITIEELTLHPREAAKFCDDVRRMHGYFDMPDDIILRSIVNRRKDG